MYNKSSVKQYQRGTVAKRSYKRNPQSAPGTTTLANSLMTGEVMSSARDMWAKGRKTRLATRLTNPKRVKFMGFIIDQIEDGLFAIKDAKGNQVKTYTTNSFDKWTQQVNDVKSFIKHSPTLHKTGNPPTKKPYYKTADFEFWLANGEIYRNDVGNRGYIDTQSGLPSNLRWESSKEHFDRWKDKIYPKTKGNPYPSYYSFWVDVDYTGERRTGTQLDYKTMEKYSDEKLDSYNTNKAQAIKAAKQVGKAIGKEVVVIKGTSIHAGLRQNPGEPISPEVEDLSKEWHGREVEGSTTYDEIEEYDTDLVDLGELEELGIWASDGTLFNISFKSDRPKLACDGSGHNLEVIGGDQSIDLDDLNVETGGKRLVPLGHVYSIVYETDKHHLEGSNGYPESYEHYFAEEFYKESLDPNKYEDTGQWFSELIENGAADEARDSGMLPIAVYDRTNEKIVIGGGGYEVTDVGIKD